MVLTGCSPDGTTADQTALGAAAERTMDEFETAIAPATEALMQAPGFEALQKNFFEEDLASAIWIDSRANGNFLIAQRVDLDVTESGGRLEDNANRSTGSNVATTLIVRAGGASFVGEPGDTWAISEQPILSPFFLLRTALNREGVSSKAEFTSQEAPEGDTVWTARQPYNEGTLLMTWVIDSRGLLTSYSGKLSGVDLAGPTEDGPPGDATVIDFERVESPDPIQVPEPGSAVEIDRIDVPDDFPLR